MSMPLISVIVPFYNQEKYLAEAIASIQAQDYPAVEIIAVDDGSTDNSATIVRQLAPDAQYIYQPQSGAGKARNSGAQLAQGDFLAFLDADDLWQQNKLSIQFQALKSNPTLTMVFGHVKQFVSPDLNEQERKKILIPKMIMPAHLPGSMLIKSVAFFQVGEFDTQWIVGEFIDWYLRAKDLGLNCKMLPDIVLLRRIHDSNSGIRNRDHYTDYARIIRAALKRRKEKAK